MQRISQSLTGNHALSWLLKMPSIKKKMPSLSTNQRSSYKRVQSVIRKKVMLKTVVTQRKTNENVGLVKSSST